MEWACNCGSLAEHQYRYKLTHSLFVGTLCSERSWERHLLAVVSLKLVAALWWRGLPLLRPGWCCFWSRCWLLLSGDENHSAPSWKMCLIRLLVTGCEDHSGLCCVWSRCWLLHSGGDLHLIGVDLDDGVSHLEAPAAPPPRQWMPPPIPCLS